MKVLALHGEWIREIKIPFSEENSSAKKDL